MATKLEKLAKDATTLSAEERAAFAQLLLESVADDAGLDAAWNREAEHRIAELDVGITQAVPMEQALAQLRALLK